MTDLINSIIENRPFKQAAIAYKAVEDYLRWHTDATHPVSVDELTLILGDKTRGRQQVADAIRSFRNAGKLSSVREGQPKFYWWKENTSPMEQAPKPAATEPEADKPAPVVRVKKAEHIAPTEAPPADASNTVVIITNGVKITVEILK